MRSAEPSLRVGDQLDRRFALLRGEMERSKERSLVELARIFASEKIPYAVIGGVAVQVWSRDPRTTLDVDIAVLDYDSLPRNALKAVGFVRGRRFANSENWKGPDGAPVQFTADPALGDAVRHAEPRSFAGGVLFVAPLVELVRAKLRAADDPARRRSKRLMDFADAVALSEQHPDVLTKLDAAERNRLQS